MSHLHLDSYICLDCDKAFNHYDSSMGIVKCPYCGSTKVKIKTKEVIQQTDGKIETKAETEIIVSHSGFLEKIILLAIGLFIMAFIIPPTLTVIATSALSSVNSSVVTLFSVLVPIFVVFAIGLLIFQQTRKEI